MLTIKKPLTNNCGDSLRFKSKRFYPIASISHFLCNFYFALHPYFAPLFLFFFFFSFLFILENEPILIELSVNKYLNIFTILLRKTNKKRNYFLLLTVVIKIALICQVIVIAICLVWFSVRLVFLPQITLNSCCWRLIQIFDDFSNIRPVLILENQIWTKKPINNRQDQWLQ